MDENAHAALAFARSRHTSAIIIAKLRTSAASAIREVLRWMPDAFMRVDRATGKFIFQRRADTTVHDLRCYSAAKQLPADVDELQSVNLNPRLDLVLPRIVLSFPRREEWWECYIDATQTVGTPDYLVGIPQTVTPLGSGAFQLTHRPVHQIIEVIGGGQYQVSLSAGVLTFRPDLTTGKGPASFYVRYVAEESQQLFDTGFGGTGYDDFGVSTPVYRGYLEDFPVLIRKFLCIATDGNWVLCPAFGEAYPDPLLWPDLLGQAVNGATIQEIAWHDFSFAYGGGVVGWRGVGIRLSSATVAVNGFASITVEDNTASVAALADSLWRALRDARREGEIPAFSWLPALEVGHRVNLANTADATLATMAEPIYELSLDPFRGKTHLRLAMNRWYGLDDLLARLRQQITPQTFQQSSGVAASGAGGETKLKVHRHSDDQGGGNKLNPKRIWMAGLSEADSADDEIRVGVDGVRIAGAGIIIGPNTGNRLQLLPTGIVINIGARTIELGVASGDFSFKIDGNQYLFTHSGVRKLGAKVQ